MRNTNERKLKFTYRITKRSKNEEKKNKKQKNNQTPRKITDFNCTPEEEGRTQNKKCTREKNGVVLHDAAFIIAGDVNQCERRPTNFQPTKRARNSIKRRSWQPLDSNASNLSPLPFVCAFGPAGSLPFSIPPDQPTKAGLSNQLEPATAQNLTSIFL